VLPDRLDGGDANSADNFTGLVIDEPNGTIQVYAGGSLVGRPVDLGLGALAGGVVYEVAYGVDTTTGAPSNVTFDGSPVAGLGQQVVYPDDF